MDNRTRVVDYGRDIVDLREAVSGLQGQVSALIMALTQQGIFRSGSLHPSSNTVKPSYKTNGVEFE